MATVKRRLNITLPSNLDAVIRMLAEREGIPDAAKAVELIEMGIELSDTEDKYLSCIGDERAAQNVQYVSDEQAWS